MTGSLKRGYGTASGLSLILTVTSWIPAAAGISTAAGRPCGSTLVAEQMGIATDTATATRP